MLRLAGRLLSCAYSRREARLDYHVARARNDEEECGTEKYPIIISSIAVTYERPAHSFQYIQLRSRYNQRFVQHEEKKAYSSMYSSSSSSFFVFLFVGAIR